MDLAGARRHDGRGKGRPQDDARLLAQIVAAQGEIAQAGLDPKKVVDVITRSAQQMTRSTGAVVEMGDGDAMFYWSASGAARAHLGLRIPIAGSISGLCLSLGQVLRCDDSETDSRVNREACRQVGLRSAIVVPLLCSGHTVGVLKVISPLVSAYTPRDVDMLEMFSTFIAASLHHALEHSRLRTMIDDSARLERQSKIGRVVLRQRILGLIERNDIHAVYQPILDLESRHVIGYEGLSRFSEGPDDNGDRGTTWFAEAARAGATAELELACARQILRALPSIPQPAYLSINMSPETIMLADTRKLIAACPRDRIVIEITEHTQVDDYDVLTKATGTLRELGVRIAIDDAGAGFSSLRHVLRLSPEIIKLDLSMTRDIDTRPHNRHLASAILMYARETGTALVAEGIETDAELATLKDLGVPYGQGYLLGVPAPIGTPC